jgi:ribonucleoside-diphosphate reductase alpha chain
MTLPTQYQEYIALSRYARWIDKEKRRETWEETVQRYSDFFSDKFPDHSDEIQGELRHSILNLDVMPSMRIAMTAGKALNRDNVAGYNCAYTVIDHPRAFDEILYILLCGTGVGYSVERQYINKLPDVSEEFHESETVIKVSDSKIGWASSYRELISLLFAGKIPSWDTSKLRPAGSRLKTFGGRASGPEPLQGLFRFTVGIFKGAAGRNLTSLECHDLCCKIAEIVVVGGVRRAACISLSNLTDDRMRRAKYGEWGVSTPWRALSNNSVAYTEKPDFESYIKEMMTLHKSKAGERGIFNREAARKQVEKTGRRDPDYDWGCNPCSEIILRPNQFCNLTEVVVRPTDTIENLKEKVRVATILGTLQATLTKFRYLRKVWRNNTEEEALLGVSLTGIMDHTLMGGFDATWNTDYWENGIKNQLECMLRELKQVAIDTNKEWGVKLGIKQAAAITCVKPSGTVSQLVNSSSGIHPRYAQYYVRRVQADKKDPLAALMIDQGVPYNDLGSTYSFEFPMEAPEGSIKEDGISALEQLELWKIYQDNWCEHKPSQTIMYGDGDFLGIMDWVWKNFDDISGVSFFPKVDNIYGNTNPQEEIDKEEYDKRVEAMPIIDWSLLGEYEQEDNTEGVQTFACQGGNCDI